MLIAGILVIISALVSLILTGSLVNLVIMGVGLFIMLPDLIILISKVSLNLAVEARKFMGPLLGGPSAAQQIEAQQKLIELNKDNFSKSMRLGRIITLVMGLFIIAAGILFTVVTYYGGSSGNWSDVLLIASCFITGPVFIFLFARKSTLYEKSRKAVETSTELIKEERTFNEALRTAIKDRDSGVK